MKKDKLSPKQLEAYLRLNENWKSAYVLKATIRQTTLDALVKKGYAEKRPLPTPFDKFLTPSYRRTDKPL